MQTTTKEITDLKPGDWFSAQEGVWIRFDRWDWQPGTSAVTVSYWAEDGVGGCGWFRRGPVSVWRP